MNPKPVKDIGFSREDRDLLVELRTTVASMRQDIFTIKDNVSASIVDHETRIRGLETSVTTVKVDKDSSDKFTRYGGAVLIFIVGIIEFIVGKIWH